MLNKNICIQCTNKHYINIWGEWDNKRWNEGYVLCPGDKILGPSYINEIPSDYCPYKLEHVVNA